MDHHLLDPIEPEENISKERMEKINRNSKKDMEDKTKDAQSKQSRKSSSSTKFQINFLRPKRKSRFVRKLLGGKLFAKNYFSSSPSLVSLFVILSFIQLLGYSKDANAMISQDSKYGLTAYAEPCTDECKQRGFPYTWCHKRPSRNGTWIDRDYCSPGPGLTRYLEPCLESCHQDRRERAGDFYWCKTAPTSRGNWDYCSPYPRDACAWSSWSGWTSCNASCGPRTATRTRRRRIESVRDGPGKVGHCSGQIEQSISVCSDLPECQGSLLPENCEWSDWGPWTQCSVTCSRSPKSLSSDSRNRLSQDIGTQQRIRTIQKQPKYGGRPCDELRDGVQLIRCRAETPCYPTTDETIPEYEDEYITTEKYFFSDETPQLKERPTSSVEEGSGLSINLQFEQETTSRTTTTFPSFVSDIFTESSDSPTFFDIGSDDFSTPPESPRTFDTSKFFNTKSKSKGGFENSFHTSNEDKKNVLKDIFNILEDKDVISTTTSKPKVVVNEKRLPFTVVRVSSSVSQVRPNNNENNIRVSEGKLSNVDKEEEVEKEPSRSSLFFPTRPIPTTTKEIKESPTKPRIVPDKKKQERKKSGGSSGSRQPFLKPIAKFPDIRIPSLDKKNNVKRPRPFNFNRGSGGRPLSPILGFRTTTTTETTTPETTFESFESSTSTTSTTKPKTFANIFNRFSFATPEEETTTESIESIKLLLDLIPKDVQEAKETTSSRSLLELIPGLSNEENLFNFEEDQINNEINAEDEGLEEVSTLRASLDIIPIKSTTDRNSISEIDDETKASIEEDTDQETVEVQEKTRDLQIIPIPPRPSRPTEEVSEETTPESTTTPQKTTSRKISRLQEIVQRRRTTTSTPPVTAKNPTKAFSRNKLFETKRGGNRPTISIRFRNRPNVTQVSEIQPIDVDTSSEVNEKNDIQPTGQSPETTKEDNTVPTESEIELDRILALDEEETTTELNEAAKTNVKPTIAGGGRSKSRFRPKSKLSDLFPKRRPSGNTGNVGNKRRPFFRPRNRLTTLAPSNVAIDYDNEDTETTINTTPTSQTSPAIARRRPTFRRRTTRPPAPQNTRSPLLKSILDRARLRGVGRRTTRAPLIIVNKETTFQPRITGGNSLNESPSIEPTQSDFTTSRTPEDDRSNDIDKESFIKEESDVATAITMDYIPDDYEEQQIEDDYGLEEFVINDDGSNDIEEKVRSNAGGPDRSKKTQAVSNSISDGNRIKSRGKGQQSSFGNQQRRPTFSSPRPPLSPSVTPTFFIVNSSPTSSFISTTAASTTTTRFSINEIDDLTSPAVVSGDVGYDPCTELNACGPNAICIPIGTDPVCSCPLGFSGIPRNGVPDPSHGCVRTPQKCGVDEFLQNEVRDDEDVIDTCPIGQKCVRNFCLPNCNQDDQCSLGERCVENSCIKICFYDAHCLAGEFCEKSDQLDGGGSGGGGNNGVCIAGCRRDTNCPFGQVCIDVTSPNSLRVEKRCMNGCHFNNDCSQNTACLNQTCQDPCRPNGDNIFDECGVNAVCEVISHAPTCKCPNGFRPLNSPYVACVPLGMDLEEITCLKDTDCENSDSNIPQRCRDFQCQNEVPG